LFSGTRVTCCEIEPAIVAAAPHFAEVNHSPNESSRFTAVCDDARAYVQGTNEKYDLILSEPSNPWIAGVSNLFTVEFYRIASQKLAPSGIFAQWIQTYTFGADDYKMVIRTMREVFPYQRLIRIADGDTILLGANESLDRNQSIVQESQRLVDASSACQADLSRYFGMSDVAALLLTYTFLDERAMEKLVDSEGSRRLNLDRNLQLEFRAARHLYDHGGTVDRLVLGAARTGWFVEHYNRLGCDARHSSSLHELAELFQNANSKDTAAALVEFGLRNDPNSSDLLADKLILEQSPDPSVLERLLASWDPLAGVAAHRVGVAFWKRKQFADAVVIFEQLSQRYPNASSLWTNLAINYALAGNHAKAERAHRRALELDPTNDFSRREAASFAAKDKEAADRAAP
jgi:spermidine synthase